MAGVGEVLDRCNYPTLYLRVQASQLPANRRAPSDCRLHAIPSSRFSSSVVRPGFPSSIPRRASSTAARSSGASGSSSSGAMSRARSGSGSRRLSRSAPRTRLAVGRSSSSRSSTPPEAAREPSSPPTVHGTLPHKPPTMRRSPNARNRLFASYNPS